MMVPADFHLPRQSCLMADGDGNEEQKPLVAMSSSFTFGFLLHQETSHTLLFSYHEGNIPWFIWGHHLENQTVHATLAAHLIQVIILEVVVSKPPFHICHSLVWQLHLKDCILPHDHSSIAEFTEDANMFCRWMGWWEVSGFGKGSREHGKKTEPWPGHDWFYIKLKSLNSINSIKNGMNPKDIIEILE